MNAQDIILPKAITQGDTVGICTPSSPAHSLFPEKFNHAISELKRVGFKVKLGDLTAKMTHQGYRSGTPKERAEEFMGLINDDGVDFIMATIGGANSSSMIPYLDFEQIRAKRKIFTGYSDITSLHMAILTQSKLSTFYGPAVVPTFGEYPHILQDSLQSFLAMSSHHTDSDYALPHFSQWSNHMRNWASDDWKTVAREYQNNPLPTILNKGSGLENAIVEAPIIVANLNTLYGLAGTPYFPEFDGEILLLEQMTVDFGLEERIWTSLKLMGVFERISGLIIGKPEVLNKQGAPFSYDELIMECIGDMVHHHNYPVISGFDCSHTHPMHCIPQMARVRLDINAVDSTNIAEAKKADSTFGQPSSKAVLTILGPTVIDRSKT